MIYYASTSINVATVYEIYQSILYVLHKFTNYTKLVHSLKVYFMIFYLKVAEFLARQATTSV